MKRIYLDNAATSFPKPGTVTRAMLDYMTNNGSNISRGVYGSSQQAGDMVFETRKLISDFFDGPDCSNVVFTKNVTESLNIVLKGLLKPGDHVITTSMEHNAVMRPLNQLESRGIEFTRVKCDADGSLNPDYIEKEICENTRAVVMLHASNVTGTIMPAEKVGDICHRHGLVFVLDCAQTAGIIPVSMKKMNIDALCFTGHKALLGPQGIGGFVLSERMPDIITPLLSGGTGSMSHSEDVPCFMPDKFEPGTPNIPGIIGLGEGIRYIEKEGIDSLRKHELELTGQLLEGLMPLEDEGLIKITGKHGIDGRLGVVSIDTLSVDAGEAAAVLDEKFGIQVRVGLHCAPSAHRTIGTFPHGTLRFSIGYKTEEEEISETVKALRSILRHQGC